MDSPRFKIRCPKCQAEGKARVEMLDRRVRCKHCAHTFQAQPVIKASPPGIPKPSRESLRLRIEALEREVRAIRKALPRPIPKYPDPDPQPATEPNASTLNDLKAKLDRAVEAARSAQTREVAQKVADTERIDELRRQVATLQAQVDRDQEAPASAAFEPSIEAPLPDNSRPWPG